MQTRNLLLILLTSLAAITLSAQSGKVRGRVMDSTGSVMPGVRVKLPHGDKVVKETSSTTTGEFGIAAEPGDYRLEIPAPDFAPYSEKLKVIPDMPPQSITMLLATSSHNVVVT